MPVRTRRSEAPPAAPRRDTLTRRLAAAKLRELRRIGMSYREIGRQYSPRHPSTDPEPLEYSRTGEREDQLPFLRALDALEQGLGFFSRTGTVLHANRVLREILAGEAGTQLAAELALFTDALCRLVDLRGFGAHEVIDELDSRKLPLGGTSYRMRGSYIGLDLFGGGPTLLVSLEPPVSDPLSDERLLSCFHLTRQEARVARLLVEGCSNQEIARRLFISAHTAKHHIRHILVKLDVRSRAAVPARLLQTTVDGRSPLRERQEIGKTGDVGAG